LKTSKTSNKLKPLSGEMGEKYSGIYYKIVKGKKVYFISYRNELGKVVRKKVISDKPVTATIAKDILSDTVKLVKSIKDGVLPETKKAKHKLTTLQQMADYYFTNKISKTAKQERSRFNFHCQNEEFINKHLFLVQVEELEEFKTKLMNKKTNNILRTELAGKEVTNPNHTLSNKSVNTIISLCLTIVKYAIKKQQYKGDNPFVYVEKLEVDNVRIKQMTENEIEKYLESLHTADIRYTRDVAWHDKTPYRISYLFALLALTTGARVQTILNIKIKDINFEKKQIQLYNFKTETPYIGHIVSDKVADVINEIILNNGYPNREYLFCVKGTEKRYNNYPNPVRGKLNEIINIDRVGDELLTVRDLRNVFATRLINRGMNLSFIQNLLSHKTPNMTTRYAQMLKSTGGDELKENFSDMKL